MQKVAIDDDLLGPNCEPEPEPDPLVVPTDSVTTLPTVWDRANTYTNPQTDEEWPPLLHESMLDLLILNPRSSLRANYTPEYLRAIEAETRWKFAGEDPRRWPEDIQPGQPVDHCDVCGGRGQVRTTLVGKTTGVRRDVTVECLCQTLARHYRSWSRRVEKRFRACNLDTLQPRDDQAGVLNLIRREPNASYYLCGQFAAGKTHFAYSLAHKHCWDESLARDGILPDTIRTPKVWIASVGVWMPKMQAWSTRIYREENSSFEVPEVTPEGIVHAATVMGLRPVLLLDEVDNWSPTPPRIELMKNLLDCIYRNEGQVIMTSNSSPAQLKSLWGEQKAGAILSRIVETGYIIEF